MPEDVLYLTAGVDTQDDRFEIEVVGWGPEYESWGIRYAAIYGEIQTSTIKSGKTLTHSYCRPLKYFSSYPLPSSFGKWQKPGPSSSNFSLSISRLFPVSTPSVKRYAPSRLLFDGFWIYAAALSFEPLKNQTERK